jgi:hypothetical protein
MKDENGDLLADSHNILNGWKTYFSHLFTAEPLVPGARGSVVFKALCYKPEGSGFDSR